MLNFSFDAGRFESLVAEQVVQVVKQVTDEMYLDARYLSPVDTGTFKAGNRNMGVTRVGNVVIGTIENETEYAERVEKGFRKTPVNWHIDDRRQIYASVGSDVYAKTLAKAKDSLNRKLAG